MTNPTKPITNLTREGLREAIAKLNGEDAHACYCERSTDGGCTCALKDECIEDLMQLIDTYTQVKEREAHKDGYIQGVSDFSGYYMDASIPAQRNLIMPHIAIELTENYKPMIYRSEKESL